MARPVILVLTLWMTSLTGCGGGISLSSKEIGLEGAPTGATFASAGGAVSSLSSDSYSGFIKVGTCGLSFSGIAEGDGFLGSDPLLEVAGE